MHGSPNSLRITWQFFEKDFLANDAFTMPRDFHAFDEKYFDHFNLRVSPVGGGAACIAAARRSAVRPCAHVAVCSRARVLRMVRRCAGQTSGAPLVEGSGEGRDFHLVSKEDTRPSVLLLSHAAAYAAWYEVRAALIRVWTV
jgi:hypothetical protein